MIVKAKDAGADLAKFQLFDAEDDKGKPHYDWAKDHELTFGQAKMLFDYGQKVGIEVFFSVFEQRFVDWCEKIGVKRYKITASEIKNQGLWDIVSSKEKEKIISCPYGKVGICFYGRETLTYLWCVPLYPAPINAYDFAKISEFAHIPASAFAGISDHTIGLDCAKIALARGAGIIEKHFCLEHNPLFPDDAWSMTPEELKELVRWGKICQEVL